LITGHVRLNELIGSGFGSRRIDFDAALKIGAVFDADSRASNVTSDGAVFRDFDAPPGMDIADDLAIDNYFAGANFRIELRCGADGKLMAVEGNPNRVNMAVAFVKCLLVNASD
jgi:hypothetical protein